MNTTILNDVNKILLFLILFFTGLYFASSFLIPVAYAIILAMLLLPLRKKMEWAGIHRRWATLFCVLLLFIALMALAFAVGRQLTTFYDDLPRIEQIATEKLETLKAYLYSEWGIPISQQEKIFASFSLNEHKHRIDEFISSFAIYFVDILLIMIYVYVFLYFKSHFEQFILKLVPDRNSPKAERIMHDATSVAERYLIGKLILMFFLFIIYSIGFLIVDINYAIFYALLASILSIIPYLGNIIGAAFPFIMAIIEKDIIHGLAIIAIFLVVQFIETYIFEPLIVGRNVNLNPPFSILVIVLGGAVWGISGMILAIPYLGIMQIIFSYIEPLKPLGFLIGDTEAQKNDWINRFLKKLR
jgi:predicted PurR-regulated permease PerM